MNERIQVKPISFDRCREYWLEVNHFEDPQKKILEYVKTLGPFETNLDNPKRQAYGLFDEAKLIGVTQLVMWSETWLRYRTINIHKDYRGHGYGRFLIDEAYKNWTHMPFLFGWTKKTHVEWAIRNGFSFINEEWQDDHIGMLKKMNDV